MRKFLFLLLCLVPAFLAGQSALGLDTSFGRNTQLRPEFTARVDLLPDGVRRVAVQFRLPQGMHQTLQPDYFGLEFSSLPVGWTASPTVYPPEQERILGVSAWNGTFEIHRDLTPGPHAGPPPSAVTVKWQICFDDGVCLVPGVQILPLSGNWDWTLILLLAFLGGLILNIMPCVLPVLALKAIARPTWQTSLATAAGIEVSLLVLGAATWALQATGHAAGWGFQFQSPWYSGVLMILLAALALEWWGVWTFPTFARKARPRSTGAAMSLPAAFGNGLLTVALATPCTAPFLGTALGLTLGAPPAALMAVFALIGVGLALPLVVLSLVPAATSWMPKPGPWTRWVTRIGGVALMVTAVWLGSVVVKQTGVVRPALPPQGWEAFDPSAVQAAEYGPVLVEFTAAWCLTCQVNEAGALSSPRFLQAVDAVGARLFWGDFTNPDPRISDWLKAYGRNGVPFTLVLLPGKPPRVLPELLTDDVLAAALTGN